MKRNLLLSFALGIALHAQKPTVATQKSERE